jgi:OmpA-OmpF porin, OOP family
MLHIPQRQWRTDPMARLLSFLAFLILVVSIAETAQAQGILDRARRAAERGAERAVEREAEARADRAVTGAIECVVGDRTCSEQAQADGREVTYVDEAGSPVSAEQAPRVQHQEAAAQDVGVAALPGQGVWANYDFIPGDRALFVDDLTQDRVGNFPRRLEFLSGNAEVVDWMGRRLLRVTAHGAFRVPLAETLPERFTIEFDLHSSASEWVGVLTSAMEAPTNYSAFPGSYLVVKDYAAGLDGNGPSAETNTHAIKQGLTPVRIAVDGSYVKMYLNDHRVVNVPNANIIRGNALQFIVWYAVPEYPTYLGNFRVMAGGDDLYDRLIADGRVATQGILFATGSAQIQPESTPTLKELARTLQHNSELRLRIEGHTDSVGSADANLRLSGQRAQAVVDYLVQREGISVARLEAAGLGQTQPAADNATPEGRQANRRVELVVL